MAPRADLSWQRIHLRGDWHGTLADVTASAEVQALALVLPQGVRIGDAGCLARGARRRPQHPGAHRGGYRPEVAARVVRRGTAERRRLDPLRAADTAVRGTRLASDVHPAHQGSGGGAGFAGCRPGGGGCREGGAEPAAGLERTAARAGHGPARGDPGAAACERVGEARLHAGRAASVVRRAGNCRYPRQLRTGRPAARLRRDGQHGAEPRPVRAAGGAEAPGGALDSQRQGENDRGRSVAGAAGAVGPGERAGGLERRPGARCAWRARRRRHSPCGIRHRAR